MHLTRLFLLILQVSGYVVLSSESILCPSILLFTLLILPIMFGHSCTPSSVLDILLYV